MKERILAGIFLATYAAGWFYLGSIYGINETVDIFVDHFKCAQPDQWKGK